MPLANPKPAVTISPSSQAFHALKLENQRLRATVERLQAESSTDPLSGLANRRALDQRLTEFWSASTRYHHDLACIALDIDGLKLVNDSLGHAFGDELICIAAKTILHCTRDSDFAARVGGDEFTVLLPMTGHSGARLLADRIVQHFASSTAHVQARLIQTLGPAVRVVVGRTRAPGRYEPHIGISAGIAARDTGGSESATAMLDAADRKLYEAKRIRSGGRARLAA